MRTLIIQSYRTQDVPDWIKTCLASVKSWSELRAFDYQFVGDEIFDRVPGWYREKTSAYPQIATDLGRLHLIQEALDGDYERALWLDADVLVIDAENFTLDLTAGFTFGREIWIQGDGKGNPRMFRNVHNAYAAFCSNNPFLSFYQYACTQVISRVDPGPDRGMAAQIVGPKLLTSLHNTLGFELSHDIAMLSPDVLRDIEALGGPSLDLFRSSIERRPCGANLCASLIQHDALDKNSFMERICTQLLETPDILSPITKRSP